LEHLFVGEVMKYCWSHRLPPLEALKSQVDSNGYDIVLETSSTVRHIQLKSSHVGAASPSQNVNIELGRKPSGCVIWIFFDPDTLEFSHFLWFGRSPGEPLESLAGFKTSTHNKRNAKGVKTERPNIKEIKKAAFKRLNSIEEVVFALFGDQSKAEDESAVETAVRAAIG